MGQDAMILVFWMLSFKPTFSLSSFTFIKRLFSSSLLSSIRVVSSAYLILLIFLPAIFILACDSSSLAFHMMCSAYRASLVAQTVKNLPAVQEIWVQSLGQEDPLEKEMATNSTVLTWRIPGTEEPGRLPSMGPHRVRHDWSNFVAAADHYIYYCGQESLRRNGVAIMVNKRVRNAVLGGNLKNDRMISVCFQGKPSISW